MRRKPKVPPRPPRYSDSRYSDSRYSDPRDSRADEYADRSERSSPDLGRPTLLSALNWGTGALLAAVLIVGIGFGILFSSGTTSDVGNVATRYDIDRSAPNPEICVQFGVRSR